MGRPRLHDDVTRSELLEAAEQLLSVGGLEAVSVRTTAAGAGTSTRAVYALFGSKEGLVQALAQRAYELLMDRVAAVPVSGDPSADLIAAAIKGFRAFALDHPDLFRLVFTTQLPRARLTTESNATRMAALQQLTDRIERLKKSGVARGHSVEELTLLVDVICSGLAMREICGVVDGAHAERLWSDALGALLRGLSTPAVA